jgi:hypothetical protein
MSTNFAAGELANWCVCGRAHQSFCQETPCHWGATWPHPYDPTPSMEDIPWLTAPQAERRASYARQRAAASCQSSVTRQILL